MKRLFLLALLFLPLQPLVAKEEYRVAITVNNEIISTFDLYSRLKMAMLASGLGPSAEVEKKLLPQLIQMLTDESLFRQQAVRLKLAPTDKELTRAVANMEVQMGVPPGQLEEFLRPYDIPKQVILDQLRAQISWAKIVRKKIQPKVVISDTEMDQALEYIGSSEFGLTEVQLSEILLPVQDKTKEQQTRQLAAQLVERLRNGADFSKIAHEFSRSNSAQKGGDIGWVQPSQLEKPLRKVASLLGDGKISEPIRVEEGFLILRAHGKRSMIQIDPKESEVSFRQAMVPLGAAAALEKFRSQVRSCDDFNVNGMFSPLPKEAKIDGLTVQIKSLSEKIQPIMQTLQVGEISQVTPLDDGLYLFMLCERTKATPLLPDKNRIREALFNKKLQLQMRSYVRDLHRKAFVEVRV